MPRRYQPLLLVPIPRFDAASATAVVAGLVSASHEEHRQLALPPSVLLARDILAKAGHALQHEKGAELSADPGPDTQAAANRARAAWSASENWLEGWTRLPGASLEAATARALHSTLFPSGLRWLRLPYQQAWSEADTRLLHTDPEKLEADFTALNGTPFLDELRASHQAFGAALGLSAAPVSRTEPDVRGKLSAVMAAMRNYVLQVVASHNPVMAAAQDRDPEDVDAIRERLLAPLENWESRSASTPAQVPAAQTPAAPASPVLAPAASPAAPLRVEEPVE